MAETLNTIPLNQLPAASQIIVDNGQVLVVYGGRAYRATATLMKGPRGDKMVFADLTAADIASLQAPARAMINQLTQTNSTVSQNETLRTQAENARGQAESGRVTAENARNQAELDREQQRQDVENAENQRKQNEIDRNQTFAGIETFFDQAKIDEQTRQTQERDRQTNTAKAIEDAEAASDRSNELSNNLPEIRDGYWWRYNESTKLYENTGNIAHGNVMFATFYIDENSKKLYMTTPDGYEGPEFKLVKNKLYVTINA